MVRDAQPGRQYLVRGLAIEPLPEQPPAKPATEPNWSEGRLVKDKDTGLLVWTGDLGEDPGEALNRNRAND